MTRLSARGTYFVKRLIPLALFGVAGLILFSIVSARQRGAKDPELHVFVPFLLVFFGVAYFIFRKLVLDLVDSVWDDGDGLIVKNRHQEVRIPLSEIMSVGYAGFQNPSRVTLYLRHPSRFGDEIAFATPARVFNFRLPPEIHDLMVRVDEARSQRDFSS
jgi:hypothetical protein